MRLKVYGERNTGTQFLREILRHNGFDDLWPGTVAELGAGEEVAAADRPEWSSRDRMLLREAVIDDIFARSYDRTLGWKHGAPDPARLCTLAASTTVLVTVKNPYAWVVSMFRRPHHNLLTGNLGSIESFVQSAWVTCGRDNVQRHVGSIVDLWNQKYRAWLALGSPLRFIVVRYEDLLLDPGALARLASALSPERQQAWRMPAKVPNNTGELASYRDFYARERWREALPLACLDRISARLDGELVSRLGYDLWEG